jgi:protein TonB
MLFPRRRARSVSTDSGLDQPRGWHRPARAATPTATAPYRTEDSRVARAASFVFHVFLIALIIYAPSAAEDSSLVERDLRPMGPGPAGGGGGGKRGTGGEQVKFVQVAPAPAAQTAVVPPPVVPPPKLVPQPVPPPVVTPPAPIQPKLPDVKPIEAPPVVAVPDQSKVAGTGGGSGNDGTTGAGPGSGGGVGSGTGTGRGSGTGPGTGGGGTRDTFPPSPIELFIPPLPYPERVRGFKLIADFEVDEKGRVLKMNFTPTRDRDYNKRLEQVLKATRFRPGTLANGTPVRTIAQIVYDF